MLEQRALCLLFYEQENMRIVLFYFQFSFSSFCFSRRYCTRVVCLILFLTFFLKEGPPFLRLPCSHEFHVDCINKLIAEAANPKRIRCPVCPKFFSKKLVTELQRPTDWLDFLLLPLLVVVWAIKSIPRALLW